MTCIALLVDILLLYRVPQKNKVPYLKIWKFKIGIGLYQIHSVNVCDSDTYKVMIGAYSN